MIAGDTESNLTTLFATFAAGGEEIRRVPYYLNRSADVKWGARVDCLALTCSWLFRNRRSSQP